MKGKTLLLITLSLLLVLGLGGGIGGLWEEARAKGPEALGEAGLLASPVGTAFTYQGRLIKDGNAVDGTCDLQFSLYDAASGGTQVGTTQTKTNVSVSDGLFTVQLDFGASAFTGDARWLKIEVRCLAGSGSYTTLSPRQALTPAPYALALPGLWTQQNASSPNLIGGYNGNSVTDGVVGATIGGGGDSSYPNRVTDDYSTVGGGLNNQAGNANGDLTDAQWATVGGGHNNTASGAWRATVSGGGVNTASGGEATVGGGYYNTASGPQATIGGGYYSTASGHYATVGGGRQNTASGDNATIGGGQANTASGSWATVPGGYWSTAEGDYSFGAGRRAKAQYDGCFVWGDSTNADVACYGSNRWIARASGGVYFYTNSDLTSGVYVAAGGNSWNSISDRATKENSTPVDGPTILEKLATLPVQEYNLKSQNPSILHIGPVAQDFYAAFGYGESDKAINMEDADGVALAAIQGLYQLLQERKAQIAAQQQQIDHLEERVAALEAGAARPVEAAFLPGVGFLLGGLGLVWLARRGNALSLPKRGGR